MRGLARLASERCAPTDRLRDLLPHRTRFDVHGLRLHAGATARWPVDYLERMYAAFWTPGGSVSGPTPGGLELVVVEPGTAAASVLEQCLRTPRRLRGPSVVTSWSPWAFVCTARGDVNYYASKLTRLGLVEAAIDDIATLHAAAVSTDRAGVLLVGEAAAGKTTLTGRLLARGFRLAADDSLPVRRRDRRCLAFPTPLVSRSPGDPPREPDVVVVGEPRWLLTPTAPVSPPFEPTHVFVLDRHAENAHTLDLSDTVLALLRNTVMPLGSRESWLDLVERNLDDYAALGAGAECVALPTGDLERALTEILARTESMDHA